MVLVQRKIKIVVVIQSNRTLTQIRNFVINNIFPMWDTRLAVHFTGFPSVSSPVKDARVNSRSDIAAGRWDVYPKYFYQADVTAATADAARAANIAFLDDIRDRTRDLLAGLTGTTVLEVWKKDVDGNW